MGFPDMEYSACAHTSPPRPRTGWTAGLAFIVSVSAVGTGPFPAPAQTSSSEKIDLVLSDTQPLECERGDRLPLFFWHLRETRTAADARENT